ncbi:MAG: DUF2478 domain-containing protein [Phycisphaerales bacterium]|nr:MAG: DUF2478 domain-containing protein [Phycisphaerales bacterium]
MHLTKDSAGRYGGVVVLWTGERHSGKTTSAGDLVRAVQREGFGVAGLLAPSLYRDGKLIGFDAVDLSSGAEALIARHGDGVGDIGRFTFLAEGLQLGRTALSGPGAESADLVVVDEFGPLELDGKGWRENVDSLLAAGGGILLLVVRRELVRRVRQLYGDFGAEVLDAGEPQSVDRVVRLLRDRRTVRGEVT